MNKRAKPTNLVPRAPRRISYEREAEELRARLEELIERGELIRDMVAMDADEYAVRAVDLRHLLDSVDARDSLAFLEKKDRRAARAKRAGKRRRP